MKEKEIKRSFLEVTKRFFEPYKTNEVIYIKGIFVAFLWGINGIVHVLFLERFTFYLQSKSVDSFKLALISYLVYLILYELINFSVKKWGWVELFGYTWKYLAEYYLTKFVKLDNNRVESMGTGKLISIINSGIEKWGFLMWKIFERGISLIIVILFTIYMVSKVNIYYSLIFIVLFYIFFLIISYFNKKMIPYRGKRNENIINISRSIIKILMTKNEILQTNKILEENKRIGTLYVKDADINKEMGIIRVFLTRSSQLGMSIILLFTYYFLGFQFLDGKIELNLLVGLGGALIIMQKSISDSLTFYIDFTKDFVSVEKLWDFFDTTPEIQGYETGKDFEYKTGAIELQNITFGYEENKKVFKDFNLKLAGGKITAFVGNSGGGKTTLVKIISQYIKQDSGKVLIDGQDLDEISLKSYYKNIGYLTQEPSVFDGTILDNLTYALEIPLPNPPPKGEGTRTLSIPFSPGGKGWDRGMLEKIEKIIKLSKCEFIYDFEKGLETEIGERGVRLSGGQKQRLAIAKIMLKDPKIIILDEPTSALDSFSEELITKAMNNLFEGRTVLVIAHRLQTVKHADEIIVIEGGIISERGKHNELVEKNGIYNRMLELQSGF